jgi:diguanylate cyclase (GGDEF)-like protein/PAS domain S-box-containing protein
MAEPHTLDDEPVADGRRPPEVTLAAAVARRDRAARIDPRVRRRLQRASRVAGFAIAAVGLVVTVSWGAGLAAVTGLVPGLVTMKFNTAAGLVLVGLSLVALHGDRPAASALAPVAAAGYGLLGAATLVEDVTGVGLGFDNPFGLDSTGPTPGRMATTTAAGFVVVAVAVLALGRGLPRTGQAAGLSVLALGALAVIGHVFGVSGLYGFGPYSSMAPHTGGAFVLAGTAVLLARPDQGFVALAAEDSAGGSTVRRMLIPALVVPAVVGGLLAWAARTPTFTATFTAAVFTVAMILLAGTLVWVIGASLRTVDLRRAGAEDALGRVDRALADRVRAVELLRRSEERTRRILDTAQDAFVSVDGHGLVESWNHAAEELFGWPAREALGRSFAGLILPAAPSAADSPGGDPEGAGLPPHALDRIVEVEARHRDGSVLAVELSVWEDTAADRPCYYAFARDITSRRADEASVARLAAIVEQSGDAILALDPAGGILSWNRGAEQIFGYRADEMIGRNASSVLSPPGGEADRSVVPAGLDKAESVSRELTLIRADGRPVVVAVTSSPILDGDGALVAVSSISRDISAQKAAELALRESDARTKTSLDHMLNGFAILRCVREDDEIVDFEWIYINPAGADTYGRGVADLVGARMRTVVPGFEASDGFAELCHVVDSGEPRSRVHGDYHDETISGVFDSLAWKLDDGLAVTWTDVSDRQQAILALRASEERFRASVENLHEALSVFTAVRDDAGDIVDFRWQFRNRAASEMTGYPTTDIVGRTLLEVLPANASNGMLTVYRSVVETGEPYVDRALWQEHVWGDGRLSRRAFDVRATRLGDGLVIVTREVTQQQEQEAALARQRIELERSNTEVKLLNSLADMLQSCATSDEAYQVAVEPCAALFPEFSGAISAMRPSRDVLEVRVAWGVDAVAEPSFAAADCWAVRRGRPHFSAVTEPRCGHLPASAAHCLCVPMTGQGETSGVVHLLAAVAAGDDTPYDNHPHSPVGQLAITVAAQLSMAFGNLRLRDSLREMAIRDPLTGLFNRRYMEETLARELSLAARRKSQLAVIVIDVDHFKAYNDSHGHDAGDAVLDAVGDVLTRFSRTSDVACRYGGEEFVIILPDCSTADARRRADDLRRRVAALRVPYQRVELSGPTISCGVASFPDHGSTSDELIRLADAALYRAKRHGRDQVVIAPLRPDAD